MSGFDVDIVSPQFPCGAAWLANALLELGLALPELWGFDTAREWQQVDATHWRYVADDRPWAQTLASPRPGRIFERTGTPRLRFTHAFPWQIECAPRRILFVRDPRDALYSEWRRHLRNEGLAADTGLLEFARSGFWGGPASFVDLLWLHLQAWLNRDPRGTQTLVLRFEDSKRSPQACIRRVLDWLGLTRSDAQIDAAIEASRVERLQRVEAERGAGAGSRVFNRAGQPFEWQQAWWPHWHRLLGPHWAPLLQALGYPPLQTTQGEPLRLDLPAVLAWRGLSPEQQGPWLHLTRATASVSLPAQAPA